VGCIVRSFINYTVLLTRHYSGDQIKKNEMDREYGRYGRQERCIQVFDGETGGKEPTWMTLA